MQNFMFVLISSQCMLQKPRFKDYSPELATRYAEFCGLGIYKHSQSVANIEWVINKYFLNRCTNVAGYLAIRREVKITLFLKI